MENNINNELDCLKKDNLVFDQKDEIFKNSFAEELKNGMGNSIIHTLNNPIKISKFKFFKFKIKKIIKDLFEVI